MTKICAKHEPYENGHLVIVDQDMDHAGAPTIRAVLYNNMLYALEGSHRLYLSHERGLIPKIIVLSQDTEGCEDFFNRVSSTLPCYEFPYVLALYEEAF